MAVEGATWPGGQDFGELRSGFSQYIPAGQGEHVEGEETHSPGEQGWQLEEPSREMWPMGQGTGSAAGSKQELPAGHGKQVDWPHPAL